MNTDPDRWKTDDDLLAAIPERTRLAAAAWVIRSLHATRRERGTYRVLLGHLGFSQLVESEDPYRYLMEAGALEINNALTDTGENEG